MSRNKWCPDCGSSLTEPHTLLCKKYHYARAMLIYARSILRDLEWSDDPDYEDQNACPVCYQDQQNGHKPYCILKMVLGGGV